MVNGVVQDIQKRCVVDLLCVCVHSQAMLNPSCPCPSRGCCDQLCVCSTCVGPLVLPAPGTQTIRFNLRELSHPLSVTHTNNKLSPHLKGDVRREEHLACYSDMAHFSKTIQCYLIKTSSVFFGLEWQDMLECFEKSAESRGRGKPQFY